MKPTEKNMRKKNKKSTSLFILLEQVPVYCADGWIHCDKQSANKVVLLNRIVLKQFSRAVF